MPVLCTLRSTAVWANANPGNNWHENCTSQLDCCWNYTSAPTLARFTPLSVTKTTNRHKWIINPVMKMTLSCLKVAPWCAVPWHRARRVSVYPTRGCITCQKMFSLGMMIWFLIWIFFCYLSQRAVSWVHKALYEMLLSYLPAWAKQWDGHIFMNTGCSVNINMPLCGVYIFFLLLPLFVFFLSLNAFLIRAAELFQTFLIWTAQTSQKY